MTNGRFGQLQWDEGSDHTIGHWSGIEPVSNDRAAVLNAIIAILNNNLSLHKAAKPEQENYFRTLNPIV